MFFTKHRGKQGYLKVLVTVLGHQGKVGMYGGVSLVSGICKSPDAYFSIGLSPGDPVMPRDD